MKIPVNNWYYLLSYAAHYPLQSVLAEARIDRFTASYKLLAHLLIRLTDKLIKIGLVATHVHHQGEVNGVKGKLYLSYTLRRQLQQKGKTYCRYPSLDVNHKLHQILVSTLHHLMLHPSIDSTTSNKLKRLKSSFEGVAIIRLSPEIFNKYRVSSTQRLYRVILQLCEWIYYTYGFQTSEGTTVFYSMPEENKLLASIFESFVRNFYTRHLGHVAQVKKERISWVTDQDYGKSAYFPRMETDVSLIFPKKKIIVETKFYADTLTRHYRGERSTYHSSHLYQIFAYLKNVTDQGVISRSCTGILLYPQVYHKLDDTFSLSGHTVRIYTLDLSQEWKSIHDALLQLIAEEITLPIANT